MCENGRSAIGMRRGGDPLKNRDQWQAETRDRLKSQEETQTRTCDQLQALQRNVAWGRSGGDRPAKVTAGA